MRYFFKLPKEHRLLRGRNRVDVVVGEIWITEDGFRRIVHSNSQIVCSHAVTGLMPAFPVWFGCEEGTFRRVEASARCTTGNRRFRRPQLTICLPLFALGDSRPTAFRIPMAILRR